MGLNIFVTGGEGLIGTALYRQLGPDEFYHKIFSPNHTQFDVTDFDLCHKILRRLLPDILIHCAGYTSMDKAESNPEECFYINYGGTKNIVACCYQLDIPLVYFSTDAVFDGTKEEPYTIDDEPNPISVYGQSKLLGEEAIRQSLEKYWIIRSTGIYGPGRSNYITDAMDQLQAGQRSFKTVMDQLTTPTYVNDLVKVVENLIDNKRYGLYHYTNEGLANRWRVISHIADTLGIKDELYFSNYEAKAKRPTNARLKDNTGCFNRHWKQALEEFIING